MNAEYFAEWYRRQGITVIRSSSSYWYEASRYVYQAFPYHWLIEPDEQELDELLRGNRMAALRYSTPITSPEGCISYHAVCENPEYSIELLDRRSRQNIRNGLNNCRVTQISIEQLAEEGWSLESDTANRQGRRLRTDEIKWRNRYLAAADLPGFEAWGAMVDDRLVASLFTIQVEDWCEMISQQCHRDYLKARVNNALTYFVTQTMMKRSGIKGIFYTLQSLDAPPSVDEFKFRMGYQARPVCQRVVFHPWMRPWIGEKTLWLTRNFLRLDPSNPIFAKADGMLRFYLKGRKPLEVQDWPECLNEFRVANFPDRLPVSNTGSREEFTRI